jgi:hypothetical protein
MAHFKDALAKTNEKIDDKKSFSFDFSLDLMSGIEDNESGAAKKRNRSKSKKKKTKDGTVDAISADLADDKFVNDEAVSTISVNARVSEPANDLPARELITDVTVKDTSEATSTSTACGTDLDEAIKKKKKKKKKTKAKTGKAAISDEEDDIDSLVREINLLTASDTIAPTSSITNIPISGKIQSMNSINTPNKKNETISTFSFKSHKDPELSEEQRALFRFGNGKNLVAIGPPKQKARDSIWRLPPPPGLKIPSEIDNSNNQTKSEPQSHCSPFSFGFGL